MTELGLKDWLSENKTIDIINVMNGGEISIRSSDIGKFTSKYAEYIDSGKRDLCYSEFITHDCFKMFYDIDIIGETVESNVYLEKMIDILHRETVKYYPGSPNVNLVAIICTTQTADVMIKKEKLVDGKIERTTVPGKKTGFHIIYPNLRVNVNDAKQIRLTSVDCLIKFVGERESYNTWSKVINDKSYIGGLKMCGSVNPIICPCGKKKYNRSIMVNPLYDSSCTICDSEGMCLEERWYTAAYSIDVNGMRCGNLVGDDMAENMRLTSIRCTEEQTRTVENILLPTYAVFSWS